MAERNYDSRSVALDAAMAQTPRVADSLTQPMIRGFLDLTTSSVNILLPLRAKLTGKQNNR
jgi:hypothetical protein